MTLEELNHLEEDIRQRVLQNRDDQDFVPYCWLVDLLEEERIRKVLDETKIEVWRRPVFAAAIRADAMRIFGTLVLMKIPHLMSDFITCEVTDGYLPMNIEGVQEILGKPRFEGRLREIREEQQSERRKKDGSYDEEIKDLEARIAPIDGWATTFVQKQFIFLSPDFSRSRAHRTIFDKRPLPFLRPRPSDTDRREGHFGEVSEEKLPPPIFGDDGQKSLSVIRKQLKSRVINKYLDEERCLRLLNVLSHPNILELFGSYTYSGAHNFLFPMANLGDLHDLLEHAPPPAFLTDSSRGTASSASQIKEEAFYEAACGLASALEKLHYYSNEDLKLDLIGCHHDLKPRNILVHDSKFILADFGLSTMKDSIADPETLARDRDHYFNPPEAQDYFTFEKYPVGPPSDVWSFGCILAVLLAYMKDGGPKGVEAFKEQRTHTFRAYRNRPLTLKSFHAGRGQINPGVEKWLADKLAKAKADGKQAEIALVELIHDMLTIDPKDRPEIRQVLRRLRCIALYKIAEPIQEAYKTSAHGHALEFLVEKHIFSQWLDRIGPIAKDDSRVLGTEESFIELRRALSDIYDELRLLSDITTNDRPLFTRLRHSNELLLSSLAWETRMSVHRCVELELLSQESSAKDEGELGQSHVVHDLALHASEPQVSDVPSTASLSYATRVAIANMAKLMNESNNSSIPKLSQEAVKLLPLPQKRKGSVPTFRLAKLREAKHEIGIERDVLVEEMQYNRNVADETVARTLFDRMVNVLGRQNQPMANFRALRCSGFYHEEARRYFGLVYDYPIPEGSNTSTDSSQKKTVQLAELMDKHDRVLDSQEDLIIPLGDRYRLAYELVAAVYAFHQAGWIHKNISSYNILFFQDDHSKEGNVDPNTEGYTRFKQLLLASPYLIGFSHARPNEENQYSNRTSAGVGNGDEAMRTLRAYQHPSYLGDNDSHRAPYRTAFDYYSLGLVLLEIGYWKPLRKLLRQQPKEGPELTRLEKAEHLRRRRVPGLAAYMGDAYAAAVAVCIDDTLLLSSGEFDGSRPGGDSDAERLAVDRNFENLVLTPLETLSRAMWSGPPPQKD